jgi:hypothetical protein
MNFRSERAIRRVFTDAPQRTICLQAPAPCTRSYKISLPNAAQFVTKPVQVFEGLASIWGFAVVLRQSGFDGDIDETCHASDNSTGTGIPVDHAHSYSCGFVREPDGFRVCR